MAWAASDVGVEAKSSSSTTTAKVERKSSKVEAWGVPRFLLYAITCTSSGGSATEKNAMREALRKKIGSYLCCSRRARVDDGVQLKDCPAYNCSLLLCEETHNRFYADYPSE
ncbi:hypothetical protein HPP92_017356 [Vanilla planifolia]|uniref:Uncharacterized protein n=1 Tax=Vanilla planifolia TaxID=51239 RepID=A0A835QAZ4_VANPL|nr:hypothetical protein HPP92_017356 [Vanilla planifolia]